MRFKEYIKNIPIKEAVIDTPRQTYATGVFDNADTNNPKLKPAIIDMVKKQIEEFNVCLERRKKHIILGVSIHLFPELSAGDITH